jgi:superfamily II DNA or RNA helicase
LTAVILRPYQTEAVEAFLAKRKGTVQIPTGTGKTILAIDLIRRLKVPTAIIVPTIPLMEEWRRFLAEQGLNCSLFYGGEKQISPITIFTYASAYRFEYIQHLEGFWFIIVDEIHHLAAERWLEILPAIEQARYVLGLSATVERQDNRHYLFLKELPIIYEMGISSAQTHGYVAPLNIHGISVQITGPEQIKYETYTATIERAFAELRPESIQALMVMQQPLAWDAKRAIVHRKMLLARALAKPSAVLGIVKRHLEEKILLFSESIDSINAIDLALTDAGVKCGVYHSQQRPKIRREILEAWRKGYFPVLLSVRCLEEGIDVPECGVGVIVASGQAKRQLIQRVGRLIRPRPGKQAQLYYVYAEGTVEEKTFRRLRRVVAA